MPLFEVFIPALDPEGFDVTARVRADTWIIALRNGLTKLGDTSDVRSIMVDITEIGIDVTEPNSGRVFRIRELEDTVPAFNRSAVAHPAAPAPAVTQPAAPVAAHPAPAAVPVIARPAAAAPVPPVAQPAKPAAAARSAPAPAHAPGAAPSVPAPAHAPVAAPSVPAPAHAPGAAPSVPAPAHAPVAAPSVPAPAHAPIAAPTATPTPAGFLNTPAAAPRTSVAAPKPAPAVLMPAVAAAPSTSTAPPTAGGSASSGITPTSADFFNSAGSTHAGPPPAVRGATVVLPKRAPAATVVTPQPAFNEPRFTMQGHDEEITRQRPTQAERPQIGRAPEREARGTEDLIGELFEITQAVYDQEDMRAAANFILDLASQSISAESGAVFIADINASDLFFAAASGPKAKEAMQFRVPMGQGIVGFCAQEGVSLTVSDVQRDPRFYAAISKSIGYQTKSIMCCPAQMNGRVFGAIELINKNQGTSFTARDVHVVNYLAHQFADYLVNTGQTGQ